MTTKHASFFVREAEFTEALEQLLRQLRLVAVVNAGSPAPRPLKVQQWPIDGHVPRRLYSADKATVDSPLPGEVVPAKQGWVVLDRPVEREGEEILVVAFRT